MAASSVLHAGSVHGIPSHVAERKRARRGKRGGIEPGIGGPRSGSEHGLAGVVRANRILADGGSCICRVAENGDRERKAALSLVERRELASCVSTRLRARRVKRGNVIDRAEHETVTDIASEPFLRAEIVVVLRNGRFEHRRSEIRRIAQILRPGVIRKQAQSALSSGGEDSRILRRTSSEPCSPAC